MTGQHGASRAVEPGKLIGVIDTLLNVQIRLSAMHMASFALDPEQRDAMQMLATDADEYLMQAKNRLNELRRVEGDTNG